MKKNARFTTRISKDGKKRGGFKTRTWPETIADFWADVDTSGGPEACWPWTGAEKSAGKRGKGSYGVFTVLGQRVPAHRFAFQLHHGLIPDWEVISHRCDFGLCCNPAHLRCESQLENMQEASVRKRFATGVNSSSAMLDPTRVYLMRLIYYCGLLDQRVIARLFGIKNPSLIIKGEHWKEVAMPLQSYSVNRKELHRLNNARKQRQYKPEQVILAARLRIENNWTIRKIAAKVGMSPTRLGILLRAKAAEKISPNSSEILKLMAHSARIQGEIARYVADGTLKRDLGARIVAELTKSVGTGVFSYPVENSPQKLQPSQAVCMQLDLFP